MVTKKYQISVLNKDIHILVNELDLGFHILITGGERSHVGAVTVVDQEGKKKTTLLKGHKEDVVSEKWAAAFYNEFKVPVCVTAGIHYDDLSGEQIKAILEMTDHMLTNILKELKKE